jgi:hypothetical protein
MVIVNRYRSVGCESKLSAPHPVSRDVQKVESNNVGEIRVTVAIDAIDSDPSGRPEFLPRFNQLNRRFRGDCVLGSSAGSS